MLQYKICSKLRLWHFYPFFGETLGRQSDSYMSDHKYTEIKNNDFWLILKSFQQFCQVFWLMNPRGPFRVNLSVRSQAVTGLPVIFHSGMNNTIDLQIQPDQFSALPKMLWVYVAFTTTLLQSVFPPTGQNLNAAGWLGVLYEDNEKQNIQHEIQKCKRHCQKKISDANKCNEWLCWVST